MNAIVRVADRAGVDAVQTRLIDFAARYGNRESGRETAALAAADAGRAAFWTTARYHNAAACRFVLAANELGLDLALAYHADARHPLRTPAALLATLLPLNPPAAAALAEIAAEAPRITQCLTAG